MPTLRTILSLLAFVSCTVVVNAQPQWLRMSPNYAAVEWVGDSTVYLGGLYSTIMRSDDAGRTWRYLYQNNPARHGIRDVHFFDANIGIAAVDNGTVLMTRDGGERWDTAFVAGQAIWAMDFATYVHGVIVGDSGLIATTYDQGGTWTRVEGSTVERLRSVAFADETVGIAVGDNATILRTADGGASWTSVVLDTSLTRFEGVAIQYRGVDLRGDAGLIVGWNNRMRQSMILYSDDRGATWSLSDTSGLPLSMETVSFVNATRIIAGGDRSRSFNPTKNRIAWSQDGGRTWALADSTDMPTSDYGYSIRDFSFAADGLRGVACGDRATLFVTSDGGRSWNTRMNFPLESGPFRSPLQSVTALDADTAFTLAKGDGSAWPVRTTDRGLTWRAGTEVQYPIAGVHMFDRDHGLAVPTAGIYHIERKLYEIRDAGKTWNVLTMQVDRNRYESTSAPAFVDDRIGFFAADSFLFKTTDAGVSWQTISTFPGSIYTFDTQFLNERVGMVIPIVSVKPTYEQDRAVLRTDDGGVSWRPLLRRFGSPKLTSVRFLDARRGFVGAGLAESVTDGILYSTQDGGVTWDSLHVDGWPQAIRFFGDSLGFVVGFNALVMMTTDAGSTWQRLRPWEHVPPDSQVWFRHVDLMRGSNVILIAGDGDLVRYQLDQSSSVPNEHNEPTRITIMGSVDVIPNPSNADRRQLKIRQLPASANAQLSAFDSFGRLISRQQIEIRGDEGETIPFDASGLAAGIYRIAIESSGVRAGAHLVLVR